MTGTTAGPAAGPRGRSMGAEATLNELAALIVSIDPWERDDLKDIRDRLAVLGELDAWGEEARGIAAEMSALVDGVISGGDAAGVREHLAEGVRDLQNLAGETGGAGSSPASDPPGGSPGSPVPAPGLPVQEAAPATAMIDEDPALLAEFIAESLEHMQKAEEALLILEGDPRNEEAINQVFRAFHTVKGTAGFVGLDRMQEFSHKAETLLDRARKGSIRIVGGYADLALEACDMLKRKIRALETRKPGDPVLLPEGFDGLLAKLVDPEAFGIGETGHGAGFDAPAPANLSAASCEASAGRAAPGVKETRGAPVGEAGVEPGGACDPAPGPEFNRDLQARDPEYAEGPAESSIRVNTRRLDALMNMVGELVISHAMVVQGTAAVVDNTSSLARSVALSSKIVREIQDLTMALRMVPLRDTFRKMTRLVRDVARKSGKTVQLHLEGEDTEIDRSMTEALNDPLVHMVRNAVDHGIESPEERRRAGKPVCGSIWLRAVHSAGSVVIEMEDDGKGLDRARIEARAVERGLIPPERNLTDAETFNLIFAPGFSTADTVTGVSGRGVGMDVVRKAVENLRGRIDVASRPGRGATFTLRLPLTMAIIDAVVVRVGSQRYLIPAVSIEESFRPVPGSIYTVGGRMEMVRLRENLIPLVRLHRLFDVRDALANPHEALLINVEIQGRRSALMADEVMGQQQVVIKPLGRKLGRLPGLAGAAILGDGQVSLILDVAGLVKISGP